jgi:predicted anti-sigma-YlaC factor YlaD
MARNLWLEHVIDAYLQACADGRDWKEAVAEAERTVGNAPRRALTREDLKSKKGIPYCRQHLRRKEREGTFPPPFQAP